MRGFVLLALLAAPAAFADAGCNVAPGTTQVDENGQIVRPQPTAVQCELAAALQAKFLATPAGDFRRVINSSRLPEPVRKSLAQIIELENPGDNASVRVGGWPQLPDVVAWLSPELVVATYRRSDFAGTTTTVLLADATSLDACEFLRWPGAALPASLRITDIQDVLRKHRIGEPDMPQCHLKALTID
jgi:hypothetical protein